MEPFAEETIRLNRKERRYSRSFLFIRLFETLRI
jgi:hypothetical protein